MKRSIEGNWCGHPMCDGPTCRDSKVTFQQWAESFKPQPIDGKPSPTEAERERAQEFALEVRKRGLGTGSKRFEVMLASLLAEVRAERDAKWMTAIRNGKTTRAAKAEGAREEREAVVSLANEWGGEWVAFGRAVERGDHRGRGR